LFESGTPADRALAGITIRTKGSCPAGNKSIIHKQVGAFITSQRYFFGIIYNGNAWWEWFLTTITDVDPAAYIALKNRSHNTLRLLFRIQRSFVFNQTACQEPEAAFSLPEQILS